MDYFQGIVQEYLKADRTVLISPEFLIQLNEGEKQPVKGSSWYTDILSISHRDHTIYLCEVTYSKSLHSLMKRLSEWIVCWDSLCAAILRDTKANPTYRIRPWVFIPNESIGLFQNKYINMPVHPKVTTLEMTLPWTYCTYDRIGEKEKHVNLESRFL